VDIKEEKGVEERERGPLDEREGVSDSELATGCREH